jgi:hypothetical protein
MTPQIAARNGMTILYVSNMIHERLSGLADRESDEQGKCQKDIEMPLETWGVALIPSGRRHHSQSVD